LLLGKVNLRRGVALFTLKGKMRFGDEAQDLSDTLDGAEMSIEIQID